MGFLTKQVLPKSTVSFSPPPAHLKERERSNLYTVDSKKLEHGFRLIYAGVPSVFGLGLDDVGVPTFRLAEFLAA